MISETPVNPRWIARTLFPIARLTVPITTTRLAAATATFTGKFRPFCSHRCFAADTRRRPEQHDDPCCSQKQWPYCSMHGGRA
ncbi:MAG: hypothetical protein V8S98_07295 [Lachnospiraceae bacterium]